MLETLRKLREGVLDILLPKFCLGCGREGLYICKDCEVFLSEVDPILGSSTEVGHAMSNWTSHVQLPIVSVWEYEGLMEKLIYKIKFDGHFHIIDELVEKALEKIDLKMPDDTIITYVPMFKKREKVRGFNQSELIARKIGAVYFREVNKLLEKLRDNRSQVGLGPKERIDNVKGVFEFWTCDVQNVRNVLLVDDIYTTGATMRECIKTLKKAGVKNVWGFTLARKMRL